ncbi:hypothetical protein FA13DRAFT_1732459 [Coprinellus micaceus]|uniref:Uncharacterized protein n=1 Tax=Coprinellus micaceus TaxID=71717 RepID=A0A4Y7TDH0_COPMI|nr:hypothetical protein FA13DRAFT_1732459 [Coprinellus micaceus]
MVAPIRIHAGQRKMISTRGLLHPGGQCSYCSPLSMLNNEKEYEGDALQFNSEIFIRIQTGREGVRAEINPDAGTISFGFGRRSVRGLTSCNPPRGSLQHACSYLVLLGGERANYVGSDGKMTRGLMRGYSHRVAPKSSM